MSDYQCFISNDTPGNVRPPSVRCACIRGGGSFGKRGGLGSKALGDRCVGHPGPCLGPSPNPDWRHRRSPEPGLLSKRRLARGHIVRVGGGGDPPTPPSTVTSLSLPKGWKLLGQIYGHQTRFRPSNEHTCAPQRSHCSTRTTRRGGKVWNGALDLNCTAFRKTKPFDG